MGMGRVQESETSEATRMGKDHKQNQSKRTHTHDRVKTQRVKDDWRTVDWL